VKRSAEVRVNVKEVEAIMKGKGARVIR